MRRYDFEKLVASIKQAGWIRRGEMRPGRVTRVRPTDYRAYRSYPEKSQSRLLQIIAKSRQEFALGKKLSMAEMKELVLPARPTRRGVEAGNRKRRAHV